MKHVILRALEPEDIDLIYRWENDPTVWEHSIAHQHYSRHCLTQYLLAATGNDIYATRQLRLIGMAEGGAIGCADLYDFDPYHLRAGYGLLVDSALRGHGYGTALTTALVNYCRNELRLHLLYSDVAVDNIACLRALQHNGFATVGIRHDWLWSVDHYKDALTLEKIL